MAAYEHELLNLFHGLNLIIANEAPPYNQKNTNNLGGGEGKIKQTLKVIDLEVIKV